MAKMIVQMASFKGKQLIREPISRPSRKGKTKKDHSKREAKR